MVARGPPRQDDRLVHHRRVGGQARLHGGQIDEGLPGRAGLAAGRHGAVEPALYIGVAADHGPHCAVAVHGDQGAFQPRSFPALGEGLLRRPLRIGFHRTVERGQHHHVLSRRADRLAGLLVDPVDEVLRARGRIGPVDLQRVGQGAGALRRRDRPGLHHGVQHQARAGIGRFGLFDGVVARRRLHHRRQGRGFAQGQALGGLVEKAP